MTDNRTTELREKLTERGVEYDGRLLYETEWMVNGITWHAKECDGMLNVYVRNNDLMFTPEQAVAATLGSESIDHMLNTIGKLEEENERLRSSCGTLTAEQVREAIEANSWAETSTIREFNDSSWQAIADELNAELGSGTCEMTLIWTDYEDGECYECSACKGNTYTHGWTPNHCSNCGTKVKAVTR